MSLPAITVTDNPISSWANKVNRAQNASRTTFSQDFKTHSTTGGTHLTLARKYKANFDGMRYRGNYDFARAYELNDVVRVQLESTTISGTMNGIAVTFNIQAGLWVCVRPVPDLDFSNHLFESGLINANNVHLPANRAYLRYIRFTNVLFHPQYPEPTGTEPFPLYIKFWELLMPYNRCD